MPCSPTAIGNENLSLIITQPFPKAYEARGPAARPGQHDGLHEVRDEKELQRTGGLGRQSLPASPVCGGPNAEVAGRLVQSEAHLRHAPGGAVSHRSNRLNEEPPTGAG